MIPSKKLFVLFLLLAFGLQLPACASSSQELQNKQALPSHMPRDLMAAVHPAPVESLAPDRIYQTAGAEFALSLLQAGYQEGTSTLLSPYSVYIALAMTANGAQAESLSQMEQVLGLPIGELNRYLSYLRKDSRPELILANSIWFQSAQDFKVNDAFLQTNADYFGAHIYEAAFDSQTVDAINAWVKENTKGRIDSILRHLEPSDRMILLNALSFDAVWAKPFDPTNSYEGSFTAFDMSVQSAQMMSGSAEQYIKTDDAVGFIKDYENGYCFLALLPEKDICLEDYLAALSGQQLLELWETASEERVNIAIPKITLESELSLKPALSSMGMEAVFTEEADLSRISEGSLYISDVLHKCYMQIDEEGTEAAAVSSVTVAEKSAHRLSKNVVLDRPFVMAVLDSSTGTVLFLGAVDHI